MRINKRYCLRCVRVGDADKRVCSLDSPLGEWFCPECGPVDESDTLTVDDIREHEDRVKYWRRKGQVRLDE